MTEKKTGKKLRHEVKTDMPHKQNKTGNRKCKNKDHGNLVVLLKYISNHESRS